MVTPMKRSLKNGATVLLEKINHENGVHIVLCIYGKNLVTWQLDAEGNAYWGNYFGYTDDDKARANFNARHEESFK